MKLKSLTLSLIGASLALANAATQAQAHPARRHHNHGRPVVVVKPAPRPQPPVVVVAPAPRPRGPVFAVPAHPVWYKPIRRGYPSLMYLGSTSLTKMEDVDTVDVGFDFQGDGCLMLRGLVLKVTGASADIDLVQVNYGASAAWTPEYLNSRIEPNGYTQYIDLTGGERCVDAVQIVGRTLGYRGDFRQADIQIFGYR